MKYSNFARNINFTTIILVTTSLLYIAMRVLSTIYTGRMAEILAGIR